MRILLMITGLGIGGAERQVCDLADRFVALGHAVTILSLTGEVLMRPMSSSVKILDLNMSKSPLSVLAAYRDCRRHIKAFNPDVIHSHMVHANLLARLLRLSLPMPALICTAHNTNEGGALRMLAYRLTAPLADLMTNVSHEAVDAFIIKKACKKEAIKVVYNGIDSAKFMFSAQSREQKRAELHMADETKMILAVGRLAEQKDHPNLLRAFKQFINTEKNARLVIVGSGALEAQLKELAQSLGLEGSVLFLGHRSDVNELMCAADLFVLSSKYEGFGLVVAEAMLCKLPVVATHCGGVKEVIGDYGHLVSTEDSNQLALAMLQAFELSMPEKNRVVTKARARIIEHFDLDNVANQWLSLYQS